MLYVDNPEMTGDHQACRIGERIGSALKAVPRQSWPARASARSQQ